MLSSAGQQEKTEKTSLKRAVRTGKCKCPWQYTTQAKRLCRFILGLREGLVITDWWMRKSVSPEFPKIKDNAYRIRAQVDVLMPGNISPVSRKYRFDKNLYKSLKDKDGITRAELLRSAENVCRFAMTRM